jgi:hypothetical protein
MKIKIQAKTGAAFYYFCRVPPLQRRRKLTDKNIWNNSIQKWA